MHDDWGVLPDAVQVSEVKGNDVVCIIKNSATLTGSLFTLHASQIHIDLPTLTEKDKEVSSIFHSDVWNNNISRQMCSLCLEVLGWLYLFIYLFIIFSGYKHLGS